jgi:hypothetical protein
MGTSDLTTFRFLKISKLYISMCPKIRGDRVPGKTVWLYVQKRNALREERGK